MTRIVVKLCQVIGKARQGQGGRWGEAPSGKEVSSSPAKGDPLAHISYKNLLVPTGALCKSWQSVRGTIRMCQGSVKGAFQARVGGSVRQCLYFGNFWDGIPSLSVRDDVPHQYMKLQPCGQTQVMVGTTMKPSLMTLSLFFLFFLVKIYENIEF